MLVPPLKDIKESDVAALIGQKESLTLEFKEDMPDPGRDGQWTRLLKSVAAFAGTRGGDIVIGIVDEKGIAVRTKPIPASENQDALIRQAEQKIQSKIFPPPVIQCESVDIESNGFVIVIRVFPTGVPHQLDDKKFYRRNNRGNDPMGWQEVQSAFELSSAVTKEIDNWRQQRIENFDTSIRDVYKLDKKFPYLMLHLIPVFREDRSPLLNPLIRGEIEIPLLLGPKSDAQPNVNADGVFNVRFSPGTDPLKKIHCGYTQLFRDGSVEATVALTGNLTVHETAYYILSSRHIERLDNPKDKAGSNIRAAVEYYLDIIDQLKIGYPLLLTAWLRTRGLRFKDDTDVGITYAADRYEITFPTLAIYNREQTQAQIDQLEEMVWNAFGQSHPRQNQKDS